MRFTLLLLCALAACSPSHSGPDDPGASPEQRWAQAGPDSYRFNFRQECFCVREQVQPVTIEVREGRISRVLAREGGHDLTGEANLRWPTVPELFARISEAQRDGVEPLMVRYDPELGYPTRIEIGSLAADAGVIYTASDLEPL